MASLEDLIFEANRLKAAQPSILDVFAQSVPSAVERTSRLSELLDLAEQKRRERTPNEELNKIFGAPKGTTFGDLIRLAPLLRQSQTLPVVLADPSTGELKTLGTVPRGTAVRIKPTARQPSEELTLQEKEALGVRFGTKRSEVGGLFPVAPTQRSKKAEFEQALPLLGALKEQVQGLNLAESIQGTATRGTALKTQSFIPATNAGIYKSSVGAFLSQLTRAAGERGVLTNQDVERIRKALPTFLDTKASAAKKFDIIEGIFNEAQDRFTAALQTQFGKGQGLQPTKQVPKKTKEQRFKELEARGLNQGQIFAIMTQEGF